MSTFYREDLCLLLDLCLVSLKETNTDHAQTPPACSCLVRQHQESDGLGRPEAFAPVLPQYLDTYGYPYK
jgi:hypothetical protein